MDDRAIDDLTASLRRTRAAGLLLPLFFLSGATALTYQTLWMRELQIELFGTSTFAVSTVLAAFMGGLALGGFAMGRLADRMARPLAVYGWLEIGIGVYALLFPALVHGLQPVYLEAWRELRPDPVTFGLIQFVIVGAALLLPTAAMGATLPILARFATERLGESGERVGTLYAVNTLGAVVGTAACGFWLLPELGRAATTGLAAGANVGLGLAALGLSRWAGQPPRPAPARADTPDATRSSVLVAIGLAGFAALVYEVAWTRLLGLMLGGSTYAFTTMLLSFLVGIAAGGALGGPLADRLFARGGVRRVLVAFALVEIGVAAVSWAMMYVYPQLPFAYVWMFDWVRASARPERMWEVGLGVAGLVMTPPAVLMGLHFPLAVRASIDDPDAIGAPVGRVYGANTVGGVLGAFLAGFVLLPVVWLQGTVYVATLVELVAAGVLLWAAVPRRWALGAVSALGALALALVALRPPWDPLLMTAGMHTYASHFDDHSREGIDAYAREHELLFYTEGLSTVVTVGRNPENGNLWLANNGKVDASSTGDLATQLLLGLLPMQYVATPDDVLVIGLASGITAGAVAGVPTLGTLEVVELEPRMAEAAAFFGPYNHDVLDDPRLELVFNDGRNHVLLAAPGRYDLVVSEPPNPWLTGVANLFTREFLAIGRSRLAPGGVWTQWMQVYDMAPDDLRTLMKTVADVFPHVNVYSVDHADLILVASDDPLPRTLAAAEHVMQWPEVRRELARIEVTSSADLLATYQFDQDTIRRLARDLPLNTDDNMLIEYSAPRNLHRETQQANAAWITAAAEVPVTYLPRADDLAALAKAYHRRDDDRAWAAMAAAIERAPDEETAIAWEVLAESWRADQAGD